jgi:integrase
MPADVATVLAAHKRAQAKDWLRHGQDYGSGPDDCSEGLAFCGQRGQPLNHQSVLKAGKGRFEAAGFGRDWVPRDARKTFGMVMRRKGKATMADVSAAMGHSAIGVTDRVYVGTYPDDVADVAAVIDRVFPPAPPQASGVKLAQAHRLRSSYWLPA